MSADNNELKKISRNAPCPCGSGKKYKKCCGADAVSIERLHEEQRDPDWAPEGVTVVEDDTKGAWMSEAPKWIMKLVISKDNEPLDDADRVINCLLHPYYERFCSYERPYLRELAHGQKGDGFDVAILQNSQMHDEKTFGQCPSIVLARLSDIWDVYKRKLDEFFTYFGDSDYDCEVRFDQACGGPILTLTNDRGDIEIFFMGFPDRYGE